MARGKPKTEIAITDMRTDGLNSGIAESLELDILPFSALSCSEGHRAYMFFSVAKHSRTTRGASASFDYLAPLIVEGERRVPLILASNQMYLAVAKTTGYG
jgi:hypothetical protein